MQTLRINMLGELCVQWGQVKISDADNRTKKVWLLLAYLICQRGRSMSPQKLIELLWGQEPASSNPENALRITFHRARAQLNLLWPDAGRELIRYRDGGYSWNTQIHTVVDCDRFEELATAQPRQLPALLEALALYKGDFLQKQSSETWVIPVSTHYHNLYVQAAIEAAQLLLQEGQNTVAADICRRAIEAEPYQEQLYRLLMRALAAQGEPGGAAAAYDALSRRLFDDFGIRPDPATRAVYRETAHAISQQVLPMDTVWEQLQEEDPEPGALQCDYDYFKVLCHAQSRDMARSGNVNHVVLLSAAEEADAPLTKRSMQRIMQQLGVQIRLNLRRGDVFSRCSATQYILMLPKANYENSCMVSRRVIGAFRKAHPHVNIRLQYMVQPLTDSLRVP